MTKHLLERAECAAVIPSMKKIAFGGRYGRGVVSCRKDQGNGPWGPPSMIALSGGSFGSQLGGQSIDLVMLFMTPDSVKYLLRDKVTIATDVSAAVGPLGREASAETSASLSAEILTYSRSRGLFAGVAIKGAVLQPDKDANASLYNRPIRVEQLLIDGLLYAPQSGKRTRRGLRRYVGDARKSVESSIAATRSIVDHKCLPALRAAAGFCRRVRGQH